MEEKELPILLPITIPVSDEGAGAGREEGLASRDWYSVIRVDVSVLEGEADTDTEGSGGASSSVVNVISRIGVGKWYVNQSGG